MTSRFEDELALIRRFFPETSYVRTGHWYLVPAYPVGAELGWNREATVVAFQANAGHPNAPPYGFHVPAGIRCNGLVPDRYAEPSNVVPPFDGRWGMFSWTEEEGAWKPSADLVSGSNLLNFVRSFADRFRGGR